jgi:hypothetical protein
VDTDVDTDVIVDTGDNDTAVDTGTPVDTDTADTADTAEDTGDNDTATTETERCDGRDNDGDGAIDEDAVDALPWYADADLDGFGDPSTSILACSAPDGFLDDATDCDDDLDTVNLAADELCDGIDDDCDGAIDEDAVDGAAWFADYDGDTYGDAAIVVDACTAPDGFVAVPDDCDDAVATTNPGALEVCNFADDDCDGAVDEDTVDPRAFYADADADGFGDPNASILACAAPEGYVDDATDCDDAAAAAHPGADEVCDGLDDDCDGQVDEDDAVDAVTWYLDHDADGYGSDAVPHRSCVAPEGYAADAGDCDDREPLASPAGVERCDGLDNDCDDTTDEEAVDAVLLHADVDHDGHGDPDVELLGCLGSDGTVIDASDCDDTRSTVWPGAPERCNGYDDDCDGDIDGNAVDMRLVYVDGDGDGFGDPDTAMESCSTGAGYSLRDTDCDDTDAGVNPRGTETCDAVDQDCDGAIDEGAADAIDWYVDADGDGHGLDGEPVTACEGPDGTAASDDDCDDTSADRYPGNPEVCDAVDNDCDELVDVDAEGAPTWYRDNDGDGFGNAGRSLTICDAPLGYVTDDTDCNDGRSAIHPDAEEICNAMDDDCDAQVDEPEDVPWTDWYADVDGDGFGDPDDGVSACAAEDERVADSTDCNDRSDVSYPGAPETCDGLDNNCDGTVDDPDVVTWTDWYADVDNDHYGDPDISMSACAEPRGFDDDATDCDDADAEVNPAALEQCDELDNNCDGRVDEPEGEGITTWWTDADGDGEGDPAAPVRSCIPLPGIVTNELDCDDSEARVSTHGVESCNGIDDDCDALTDEGSPADAPDWYRDADGDAHGDPAVSEHVCAAPEGFVASDRDCDDADPARSPAATEVCNEIDDDCDGELDEGSSADATVWYADADGDGFGNLDATKPACAQPERYLPTYGDCDDRDASVHPDGVETCNDIDDDCDGSVDEGAAVGAQTYYADLDRDTFGDPATATLSCSTPEGYTLVGEDCDDALASVNPEATEVCNGHDDNCDGATDGADAANQPSWYRDADSDGYGSSVTLRRACTAPVGYLADRTDCDDVAAEVNPGAVEVCGNAIDDDCDGQASWCGPYGRRDLLEGDALFVGGLAGDGLGRAVTIAPDLDGDGLDDVVVGGIGMDEGAANGGGAHIYGANPEGLVDTSAEVASLYGTWNGGFAGRSIDGLGDVDGDGFGDLVVGAYHDGTTGTEAGAAYFLRGPINGATSLDSAEGRYYGEYAADWAGYEVRSAGDVDGDGTPDLLFGAPYEDAGGSRAGAVYLTYGVPNGDLGLGDADAKFIGEEPLDRAGTALAGPGDLDGDGFDDLVIGAWYANSTQSHAGVAYIVYGPVYGDVDLSMADAELGGEARNDRAGIAISGPGDMDGDGLPDILVGADMGPNAYVVTGAPTGSSSLADASAILLGEDSGGGAGWSVDGAGDVDGDGNRDLLVGAPLQASAGAGFPGVVYLVCGPVSGNVPLRTSAGRLSGSEDGDNAGYSVAGDGDVDGDGLSDILAGAWASDQSGTAAGMAYLFYGAARE